MMELGEEAMQYMEDQIPELAQYATRQAYWHTLASGDTVVIAEDGKLWEIFPDGSRRYIKDIPAPSTIPQRHFTIPAV